MPDFDFIQCHNFLLDPITEMYPFLNIDFEAHLVF